MSNHPHQPLVYVKFFGFSWWLLLSPLPNRFFCHSTAKGLAEYKDYRLVKEHKPSIFIMSCICCCIYDHLMKLRVCLHHLPRKIWISHTAKCSVGVFHAACCSSELEMLKMKLNYGTAKTPFDIHKENWISFFFLARVFARWSYSMSRCHTDFDASQQEKHQV